MFTKNAPVMIFHLRGLIKKHDLYIDRCIEQAGNGSPPENHELITRYIRDHKLMGGELTLLLKGLGQNPEDPEVLNCITKDRPKRIMQSLPMEKGLPEIMAVLDRDILRDYLSMLEVRPISVTTEDRAVQHIAFLRKLLVFVGGYGENIMGTDMDGLNYRSKSNMNVWR